MAKGKALLKAQIAIGAALAMLAAPLAAKEEDGRGEAVETGRENAFAGDWLTLGVGLGFSASYSGSDDYVLTPVPIVQGRLGGIGISPRAAGVSLDVTRQARGGPDFAIGPSVRFRGDRNGRIKDDVVKAAGKLDNAFELGLGVGYSLPGVILKADRVSFGLDTRWDVAGAHGGMVLEPGVTYFTPLSRGMIASLSLNGQIVDDDFAGYYYSVSPAQSAASGLPEFTAKGGLNSLGATLLLGFDLDGNARNGGLSLITITGYSRLVGDAADTPFTAERGSADQFFGAVGLGYTF
ncbi:MipA/OmpV family protein [Altererythrobacter sp. Z27]|uniref:MipA/OmpV family protein n=1 Tax=Altererythrobacter sp. Z27 TaxID=3461147 RepID=UPI004044151A